MNPWSNSSKISCVDLYTKERASYLDQEASGGFHPNWASRLWHIKQQSVGTHKVLLAARQTWQENGIMSSATGLEWLNHCGRPPLMEYYEDL